jgi:hypothetical protein
MSTVLKHQHCTCGASLEIGRASGSDGSHGQNMCTTPVFHTALQTTPFHAVYGRDPPSLHSYDASEVKVVAVDQNLVERDEFLQDVRLHLEQAH